MSHLLSVPYPRKALLYLSSGTSRYRRSWNHTDSEEQDNKTDEPSSTFSSEMQPIKNRQIQGMYTEG